MAWMRFPLMMAVAASGLSLAAAEEAEGADTTVTQAELPAKVMATVREMAPGAEFVHAVKADEDGVAVYEVTVQNGARKMEVQTTLDGELTMREEVVEASALPKAALDRIMKAHPGAKVAGVERTLRTVYEVRVTGADGKASELLVTPGGQLAAGTEKLGEAGEKGESEADEDEAGKAAKPAKGAKAGHGKAGAHGKGEGKE